MTDQAQAGGAARVIGVAIPIAEPYCSELQAHRADFGDPLAQAIPTHVTLLPPVTVDEVLMPEIEGHLESAAAQQACFEIELRGSATFRPVSPVVFVQLARGISGCERLEREIRSGLLARDLEFPYHPHVTVAHDLPDLVLDRAFDELAGYQAGFTVREFCLYEHVAGVWRVQRSFSLTAPEAGGAGPAVVES